MPEKKTPLELGKRERQIVETVTKLEEASVSEVLANLADAPSYSAVRAMLNMLVEKKWLKLRRDGKKYLYRPAADREKTQRNAVARLLDTFFGGSPTDAFAALLESSPEKITDDAIERMSKMIKEAKQNREKE